MTKKLHALKKKISFVGLCNIIGISSCHVSENFGHIVYRNLNRRLRDCYND